MKLRILLLIAVFPLIFSLLCFSEPVSLDSVIKVGESHIALQIQSSSIATEGFLIGRYSIQNIIELKENEQILGYIAELNPEGFIAISSNTDIHPVIAYSFNGKFSMEDSPENIILKIIRLDLKSRLEAIPFTPSSLKLYNNTLWEEYITQSDTSNITYTQQWGPLLNTTWHQGDPYNKYCPIDPVTGNRSVIGCNAIAYAQILNYWKYPRTLSFTDLDKYTTKTRGIKIDEDYQLRDFLSFDDLNAKLSNIKYDGNEDEIAALCFGCGVKVNSDYTSTGTSGWIGTYYYQDNFGYAGGDFIRGDAPGFYNTLMNNMKDSKPAHLSIAIYRDGSYYDSHGIVADGYRDTGEYHLNFGWGPNLPDPITECWYFLPDGMPNDYNTVRYGMLNIYPGSVTTLLTPKGGEKIRGGSTYNITWNNSAPGTHHIHLQYSIDGGISYQDITNSTEDDGLYEWSAPLVNSSMVRVRMFAENSTNTQIAMDESTNFTIDSTPPVTIPSLSGEQTDPGSGWYTSNVEVTLSASDNLSGVNRTYYRINSGDQQLYQSPFVISGTTVYYYSEDIVGNIETEKSIEVKIDKSPPNIPVVTDDGEYTSNNTQLHATWVSSDTESDILEYMYSIGTTQGGSDIVPWTSTGIDKFVTKDGLTLIQGKTYYFSVKAKNGAGLWSDVGFSDGITYMPSQININPTSFVFNAQPGNNPNPQILSIKNAGYGVLNWNITENSGWLSCSPTNGSCTDETDEVSISVDTAGLNEGIYTVTLTVNAEGVSNSPQIVTIFLRIFYLDRVTMNAGWNLISIPVQPDDNSIDRVLDSIKGKFDSVWAYFDGGWKKYIVGMEAFRNLNNIIPGRGYWVKMKERATLSINGNPIENIAVQLFSGWNLVGYNQKGEKITESALTSVLQNCISAWTYERDSWKKFIKGSIAKDLLTMGPWRGYWLNVSSNCSWESSDVNPSPPLNVYQYKTVQSDMPEMPYVLWGSIDSKSPNLNSITMVLKVDGKVKSTAKIKSIDNEVFYSIDVPVNVDNSEIYIDTGDSTETIKDIPSGNSGQVIRFDLILKTPIKESKLYQNYPNPFNPETWIPFQLKEDADVEIKIYNLAGQCIRTLKLGYKTAGIYLKKDESAYWNGKNDLGEFVSSGVYFYSINTNSFSETRKMILLR
ncbi:MAG: C10 family peptidase [bacterium]